MNRQSMNRGFTLIEIGIVLIIIGLLIGGILVAQSMIQTAKINKTVAQLNQYGTAINNFKTKFDSLPGDTTKLGNPGNGDGRVSIDGVTEQQYFWVHLSQGTNLRTSSGGDYARLTGLPTLATCPVLALDQSNEQYVDTTFGATSDGKACLSAY